MRHRGTKKKVVGYSYQQSCGLKNPPSIQRHQVGVRDLEVLCSQIYQPEMVNSGHSHRTFRRQWQLLCKKLSHWLVSGGWGSHHLLSDQLGALASSS